MKKQEIEKRIEKAFCDVDFANFEQVDDAAEELKGVEPSEVIGWISDKLQNDWHWDEVISYGGVQNVEKAFGVTFDTAVLINAYFSDDEHWSFEDGDENRWLDEFNELTGKNVTANDLIENLDIDFLVGVHSYGPGLCGIADFLEKNSGDFRILIRRLAPEVEKFSHEDVEDVIYCLDDYIEDGDIDMSRLFDRIEWSSVHREELGSYISFFERHAPELLPKIPMTM